ncbi:MULTISPECIES: c-type cytochrome [Cupriavidus]|jgi:hypothetical protein|uniref:c-type cytochrome n=1 Tax=Cupriavidus TaxID=106589 RepID=UPI0004678584|nr:MULTISPECIES: hypothetical protein [Cupriavidus]KWR83922.1 cytochrome C [Cupriavidus sp. SHE]
MNPLACRLWRIVAWLALLLLAGLARADPPPDAGERIFRQGTLASGEPLQAIRDGGMRMEGQAAACMNCHRRSGLGARAGLTAIPPITGRYLFHPRASNPDDLDLPFVDGIRIDREPYTEATLARAIRSGLDSEGRPLSYLMPHFALGDADMAALIGFLKRLDARTLPGVDGTMLHFATIITPDADPVKRQGMLDVLQHYFADKNAFPLGPTPRLRASRSMMFMVNRRWQLHVWELSGAPSTWQAQLQKHLAEQPVLAVVSGLGGSNWAPVHAFCEQAAVPCLFPNVEVPAEEGKGFYSLYFSNGVTLEAQLMARSILRGQDGKAVGPVLQVYREGDSGDAGARALAAALLPAGVTVSNRVLKAHESIASALRKVPKGNVLVLWLRPPDVVALGGSPPPGTTVLMSGLMGGLEHTPVPAGWRAVTELTYPVDLPERRRVRVDYALGWFTIRRIPLVAEQVQADTFLACGLLAETLNHMADTFQRDYLVERVEDMIERRVITGYYPRLTLAPGQRFASKGGYMVRFSGPDGARVAAEGDWTVP